MESIEATRAAILDRTLRALALIGAVAYIPSLYACVQARLWYLAAADSAAFAAFVAVALLRGPSYRVKLLSLIALSLLIGAAVLYATGPYGAGYVWILYAILEAVLLGSKPMVRATAVASAAVLGAYALLVGLGKAPIGQPPLTVLVVAANLGLVAATFGAAANGLFEGLRRALAEKELLSHRLRDELFVERAAERSLRVEIEAKEALLRELNHRVRNNLQVVESLLRIEAAAGSGGPAAIASARMSRRVEALSLVNESFLQSSPASGKVELSDIVKALVESRRSAPDELPPPAPTAFSREVTAEEGTSLAIATVELLDALAARGRAPRIGLVRYRGADALAFSWDALDETEGDRELGAALAAAPAIGGLAPAGAAFEPAGAGEEKPRLLLPLA